MENIKYLKNGEFSYNVDTGLLGKGAFGSVFKGTITSNNQIVAIKALSLKLLVEYGEDIREIIINEVAVMKDLSNMMMKTPCPFIVRIYDCFLTENNVYLVLQFCDSGNLQDDIDNRDSLPEKEAKVIIYQMVRALDFIADHGIIHRDIKPQNVFKQKSKSGTLIYKLGDFGLAINKNNDTQTAGTAPYMAPQMIKCDTYGKQVDIFSLGCVAHQILFGEIYFLGETESEVKQLVLNKPYKVPKGVSPEMQNFLQKCMKKDKNERIKHKQLRKHPVFRELEISYDQTYSTPKQSGLSVTQSTQSTNYNPNYTISFQQSSQLKVPSPIIWKVNNEVHKAIFLQEIGRRLLHVKRQNNISIYLIKDALFRLNRVRDSCKKGLNFTDETPQMWKSFSSSKQFKSFYQYVSKALDYCMDLYNVEHQVFTNYLTRHPEQKAQALARLGTDLSHNIDQQGLFSQLFTWSQFLAQSKDQESRVLAQECILAIKMNQINFDFADHNQGREKISSEVLFTKIKSLG